MDSKDAELEFKKELKNLETNGLKSNPLRLEYEEKVRGLSELRDKLIRSGCSEEETARSLHEQRRILGEVYKDAAPPIFREYIFYATEKKYGDPLGPDYDTLRKTRTPAQIIDSATRPIQNLDDRLTTRGFIKWFHDVYCG